MRIRKRTLFAAVGGAALIALGIATWSAFQLTRDPNEIALGAPAPAATVLTSAGEPTDLAKLNPGGLSALVFYRGAW